LKGKLLLQITEVYKSVLLHVQFPAMLSKQKQWCFGQITC